MKKYILSAAFICAMILPQVGFADLAPIQVDCATCEEQCAAIACDATKKDYMNTFCKSCQELNCDYSKCSNSNNADSQDKDKAKDKDKDDDSCSAMPLKAPNQNWSLFLILMAALAVISGGAIYRLNKNSK